MAHMNMFSKVQIIVKGKLSIILETDELLNYVLPSEKRVVTLEIFLGKKTGKCRIIGSAIS